MLPSGDLTGDADTAAIQTAIAADGVALLGPGEWYTTGLTLGQQQAIVGVDGWSVTTLFMVGAGDAIRAADPAFSNELLWHSVGGPIRGLTIDGTHAGAGSSGVHYGDLMSGEIDVIIQNFTGTDSVGLWLDNHSGWAEKLEVNASLINNTTAVLFDSHTAHSSFSYSRYVFYIIAEGNQNGIVVRDNGNPQVLHGVDLKASGNFQPIVDNSAVALHVGASGAEDNSLIEASRLEIGFELGGNLGTAPTTIMLGRSAAIHASGSINYKVPASGLPWTPGNVYRLGNTHFTFSGHINVDDNLGTMAFGQSSDTVGAATHNQGYADAGVIYLSGGNHFELLLASGANAITLDGPMTGHSATIEILLQQPISGTAGTLTWPANVKWAGGLAPDLSIANGAIDRLRLVTLDYITFYGELVGRAFA